MSRQEIIREDSCSCDITHFLIATDIINYNVCYYHQILKIIPAFRVLNKGLTLIVQLS